MLPGEKPFRIRWYYSNAMESTAAIWGRCYKDTEIQTWGRPAGSVR